jgi:biotin carboxyl carrier protein
MSTYVALLDGGKREEKIEVKALGPGVYEITLRGRTHLVDAYPLDHGTLSLLVDGASYAALLDERGAKVHVRVRESVYPLEVLDERRLRMRRAHAGFTVEGRQTIVSPMAGRVVKVLVRAGDEVKRGQPLVVVEAMKMENELRSPKDGKVVEVQAAEGQTVEPNARLCVVE